MTTCFIRVTATLKAAISVLLFEARSHLELSKYQEKQVTSKA